MEIFWFFIFNVISNHIKKWKVNEITENEIVVGINIMGKRRAFGPDKRLIEVWRCLGNEAAVAKTII